MERKPYELLILTDLFKIFAFRVNHEINNCTLLKIPHKILKCILVM